MSSEGSRDVQLISAFNILGSSISANDIQEFVDGLPETYKMGDEVAISAMKPTDTTWGYLLWAQTVYWGIRREARLCADGQG